jgi:hypothetical protein
VGERAGSGANRDQRLGRECFHGLCGVYHSLADSNDF